MKRTLLLLLMCCSMGLMAQTMQMDLPVTFDDTANVNYSWIDFNGTATIDTLDPTGGTNLVSRTIKGIGADFFAGTTLATLGTPDQGFANPIPFTATSTKMSVRVYSPLSGIPVRLKVEDETNPGASVETETLTTVANAWDTLIFDFSNQVAGTAALDIDSTYDKATIFFNFGANGTGLIYFWDDMEFVPDTTTGGGSGGTSPYCNTQVYHLGNTGDLASSIFLTIQNTSATTMKVEIESVDMDTVDFLLVNGGSGAAISPEDFSVPGKISRTLTWTTPPTDVDLNVLWSKNSFPGNWQLSPMDITIPFTASCAAPPKAQMDLPVTFDDTANVEYSWIDFGGNATIDTLDPTGGTNLVLRSLKTVGSNTFAGTTLAVPGTPDQGFANPIPFSNTETKMTVRVYSPLAGIPVRLKVEDQTNSGITVETEALTTVANAWDTLTFDFANPAPGTAALNLNNTYDKATIFFNFDVAGMGMTYYWDDVEFIADTAVGSTSPYCNTQVYHLGNTADLASSVFLTVKNTGPTTMMVEIESADMDTVDFLLVNGGSGAAISPEDFSVPGKISRTLTWTTPPTDVVFNVLWSKVSFPGNWQLSPMDVTVPFSATCVAPPKAQMDLPVTFDDTANVEYAWIDFGGNATIDTLDPTGGTNLVLRSLKTVGANTFAGTTLATMGFPDAGFANAIPFTTFETFMSVRVYSPAAGIPVRLKVEDENNGTIASETETLTTVANAWETLIFNFADEVPGTPALNVNNTYNKVTIFFDFDAAGAGDVFFWDDVEFIPNTGPVLAEMDLPVTFEDTANVEYSWIDFAGAATLDTLDPTGGTNLVLRTIKTAGAQTFAGTTLAIPGAPDQGFINPVPFTAADTRMSVRVYSPAAGIVVRLKVEDENDAGVSVETETSTTVANAWDTLFFNFSNPVVGTLPLDLTKSYNKATIFFDFDNAGVGDTYFWDDVAFATGGGGPVLAQMDLPVTFDDTANINYSWLDFGGTATTDTLDPSGATNQVLRTIKTAGAQTFAGTTLAVLGSPDKGFANPIPFTATETSMSVRVYAPAAGITVRLKVEDENNSGISVETDTVTTVANAWDTLVFDFSNEAAGTTPLNLANTYNKATIFFNFDVTGAGGIYYWDDVEFVSGPQLAQIDLPVTFEDPTVDYTLTDFEGTFSELVADPTGGTNTVAKTTKSNTAQFFAGTTMGPPSGTGFATAIPFSATETRMSVMVYSPDAGVPVRLKVEDSVNDTISVETEDTTTVADAWEMLIFDFSNEVMGTAALDLANTYDKASIFFNFGTDGMTAGEKIYYWDDVEFGVNTRLEDLRSVGFRYYPNPVQNRLALAAEEQIEEVRVYNLMGQEMMRLTPREFNTEVDMSQMIQGAYLLQVTTKSATGTVRVLKR